METFKIVKGQNCSDNCKKPSINNKFNCKKCKNNESSFHQYYSLSRYTAHYIESIFIWCISCLNTVHYHYKTITPEHCMAIEMDQLISPHNPNFQMIFEEQKSSCVTHLSLHITQKNIIYRNDNTTKSQITIKCCGCERVFFKDSSINPPGANANFTDGTITYRFSFFLYR